MNEKSSRPVLRGRDGGNTTLLLDHHTSERMVNVLFVYIQNCHGNPLMPCQPQKARLLLKEGKAKVAKMVPFTLQLLYGSSGYKQDVSLGIDAGTRHLGVSNSVFSLRQKCFHEAIYRSCFPPVGSSDVRDETGKRAIAKRRSPIEQSQRDG